MRGSGRGDEARSAGLWVPPEVRMVGIAGHRRFEHAATARFVARSCRAILRRISMVSPACVALSPLAEGADSAFAQAALDLDMPLEVIRAHDRFGEDFETARARSRYRLLRGRARRRRDLAFDTACDEAFEAAMNAVVEGCDLLVVAWDGGPPGGRGGTAHAVQRALEIGRHWIHLDTRRATVHLHGPRAGSARAGHV